MFCRHCEERRDEAISHSVIPGLTRNPRRRLSVDSRFRGNDKKVFGLPRRLRAPRNDSIQSII
jgi:hypothetical protein